MTTIFRRHTALFPPPWLSLTMLIVSLWSCADSQGGQAAETPGPPPVPASVQWVDTASAVLGTFQTEILTNGKLEAAKRAELRFRQAGEIIQLPVQNGQWVNQGQLLARIDTFQAWVALQQAEEEFQTASLAFETWRIQMSLDETDSADIPARQWRTGLTISGLAKARLGVQQAARTLADCSLFAPFSGRIANLELQTHQMTSSVDPFCLLLQDNRLQVVFSILESERKQIATGQKITAELVATASESATATITEINPVVNEQGLLQVRAILDRPTALWTSGMNVSVTILNEVPQQTMVPRAAVVRRQERDVIFTWSGDTVYWNYVQVAHENSSKAAITEGVSPGQKVVIDGHLNLSHQSVVSIRPTP